MRVALLWERTRTILEALSLAEDPVVDNQSWQGSTTEFVSNKDLVVRTEHGDVPVAKGQTIKVLMLARSEREIPIFSAADHEATSASGADFVALSRDFGKLASEFPVPAITIVDTAHELDEEAFRRLRRSASTRRDLPEHPE